MPIYEYRCQGCGEIVEAIQSYNAPPLTTCTSCGSELRKLISRSAFHLKGSGWYSDHYGLKSTPDKKAETSSSSTSSKGSEAKTETKSSEAKTETKSSEAKTETKSSETKSSSAAA